MNQRLFSIAVLTILLAGGSLTVAYADDILSTTTETTVTTVQNQTIKCSDSDNADYFTKGSIAYSGFRFSFNNEDRCIGSQKLLEYVCREDVWHATYYECPNGCKDGACIKDSAAATTDDEETDSEEEDEEETTVNDPVDDLDVSNLPDGTLVKIPNDPKVYVIRNGERVWIRTAEQFKALDLKWQDIKVVSQEKMQAIKEKLQERTTLMLNKQDRKVYRLENGKLIWVPNVAAFNAQGLKWEEVTASDADINAQYDETRLIKDEEGNVFYITNSGRKILIVSAEALAACDGENADEVTEVSDEVADSIEDVDLIQEEGDTKVYKIENGKKRWIKTIQAFNREGHNWDEVERVDEVVAASYEEASPIE